MFKVLEFFFFEHVLIVNNDEFYYFYFNFFDTSIREYFVSISN